MKNLQLGKANLFFILHKLYLIIKCQITLLHVRCTCQYPDKSVNGSSLS